MGKEMPGHGGSTQGLQRTLVTFMRAWSGRAFWVGGAVWGRRARQWRGLQRGADVPANGEGCRVGPPCPPMARDRGGGGQGGEVRGQRRGGGQGGEVRGQRRGGGQGGEVWMGKEMPGHGGRINHDRG